VRHKFYYLRSKAKLILGVIFALLGIGILVTLPSLIIVLVAFILLVVGIILLAKMKNFSAAIIGIKIEGGSYKVGAGKETGKGRTERVGIIKDSRLTIYKRISGKYYGRIDQLLDLDMEHLVKKVEIELIPPI